MSKIIQGDVRGQGMTIGIVVSRFNEFITESLLSGALKTLLKQGVDDQHITICHVPGAFELPLVAKQVATLKKVEGILCLGAVIRGETPHFDYVCEAAGQGILSVSLDTGIPISFGVLTTDTVEQAMARSGPDKGNKGSECALGLIEMVSLAHKLKEA